VISRTVLIATESFGEGLDAERFGEGLDAERFGEGLDAERFGEGLDAERFGEALDAQRVGAAIGRGLRAADPTLEVDVCPIEPTDGAGRVDGADRADGEYAEAGADGAAGEDAAKLLQALDFDRRMRAARAVVIVAARLDENTLLTECGSASPVFEVATRARQAGVPAYAVAGESTLSLFDARILDLQVVLEARGTRALRRAGEKLAGMV
jgi:glycerate kinase